ncbi:hypothetical protein [Sorangium cellulosum]|uniref:Uncharacterized protein n=1 Tax=Sorangium cellulosum So0157-2 TaxID=1254432 RepID=S4XR39_SORCE|nr:hypothetical protein [Sorangium cellulosum]AGP34330.1 hypothetical protein SCE1572_07325 [Sorangium cellulosum So0157-2]
MLRKIAFVAAAALSLGLSPLALRLGPVAGSLLLVAAAVLFAVAASGALVSLAVAGGALGALAFGLAGAASPAAAGAALAGLCFAERSVRVRGRGARLLHVGAALSGGALAGSLLAAFGAASLALRGVALAVSAVLVALPFLVDADDPVAHALDGVAGEITGPARASLREGAELRRTVAGEELLDRRAARQARATWSSLLRLAEARARLERTLAVGRAAQGREARTGEPPPAGAGGAEAARAAGAPAEAVVGKVDARIADHVAALTRAYTAVSAARAAEASLDDAALVGVETMGDSLEQVSKTMVEEV